MYEFIQFDVNINKWKQILFLACIINPRCIKFSLVKFSIANMPLPKIAIDCNP